VIFFFIILWVFKIWPEVGQWPQSQLCHPMERLVFSCVATSTENLHTSCWDYFLLKMKEHSPIFWAILLSTLQNRM
jgi:hypothetical protein